MSYKQINKMILFPPVFAIKTGSSRYMAKASVAGKMVASGMYSTLFSRCASRIFHRKGPALTGTSVFRLSRALCCYRGPPLRAGDLIFVQRYSYMCG